MNDRIHEALVVGNWAKKIVWPDDAVTEDDALADVVLYCLLSNAERGHQEECKAGS